MLKQVVHVATAMLQTVKLSGENVNVMKRNAVSLFETSEYVCREVRAKGNKNMVSQIVT
jgi:hypothetical protein